jgi:hypothetical protein
MASRAVYAGLGVAVVLLAVVGGYTYVGSTFGAGDSTTYTLSVTPADEGATASAREVTLDGEAAALFERAVGDGSYRVDGSIYGFSEPFYRVLDACGFDTEVRERVLFGDESATNHVRYEGDRYRVTLNGSTSAA